MLEKVSRCIRKSTTGKDLGSPSQTRNFRTAKIAAFETILPRVSFVNMQVQSAYEIAGASLIRELDLVGTDLKSVNLKSKRNTIGLPSWLPSGRDR